MEKANREKLKEGFKSGFRKGFDGYLWIMKIFIPVSLFTAGLEWTGWLRHVDFLLQPFMSFLSLPSIAAFPLIIGMLTNIYAGIAAMAVLSLSEREMTLIAIFLLIAHNLIQEGIIQWKSGIHPVKATLFRLAAAVFTVIAVQPFLGTTHSVAEVATNSAYLPLSLIDMAKNWALTTAELGIKIFFIVMFIITLLEMLKTLDVIHALVKFLNPLLIIMGLDKKVGVSWLTAVIFGLLYGGAVIVEEAKVGNFTKDELEELHLSIGINHALVEDPLLFVSLGLSPFWLFVPRLIVTVIAQRLLYLWRYLKRN